MESENYRTHPLGIMVVVFIKIKYADQDDEYSYHDSLQAHLTVRHVCRESWVVVFIKTNIQSKIMLQIP